MKNEISRKLHHLYRKQFNNAMSTRDRLYKHLETLDGFGNTCQCDSNGGHHFGDEILCLDCGGYYVD